MSTDPLVPASPPASSAAPAASGGPPAAAAPATPAAPAAPAAAAPAADAPWYAKPEMKLSDKAGLFARGHNFTDTNAALEYAADAETMARSRNVIEKPDLKNLSAWKGWTDLGWTEKSEDYKIEAPKEFQANSYMFDGFKKLAHENRVPVPVAQQLYTGMAEMITKQISDAQATASTALANANKEAADTMRAKWGASFDTNLELAKRAVRAVGVPPEVYNALAGVMTGADGKGGGPALMEFFYKIGSRMSEAQLIGEDAGGGRVAQSPQEARLERLALEGDPEFMKVFKDNRDPRHQDFVNKRQALLKREASKAA